MLKLKFYYNKTSVFFRGSKLSTTLTWETCLYFCMNSILIQNKSSFKAWCFCRECLESTVTQMLVNGITAKSCQDSTKTNKYAFVWCITCVFSPLHTVILHPFNFPLEAAAGKHGSLFSIYGNKLWMCVCGTQSLGVCVFPKWAATFSRDMHGQCTLLSL